MGVHKDLIKFSTGLSKDSSNASTFGIQSTGFSPGFGRQSNTVFGTFPNQNSQQNSTNNLTGFGSRQRFGNNFFHNQEFFEPHYFGFGSAMTQEITNISFTGFGEPKTNYQFKSPSSTTTTKKVTLVFENPDISSIFKKPDIQVEIEAHPLNNRTWLSNYNDFSFSIGHVEKYNSVFTMKSTRPLKYLVKVKNLTTVFNNRMPSSFNNGNQKITFTFQSNQPQFHSNSRQFETIVEVPLPVTKNDYEDFMFSVGPDVANNSFEVQTSKNRVFKITFAETGKYNLFGNNRQTRTGSVYFDQGRQMNAFPTSSGALFGSQTFGTNQAIFGSSTNGNTCTPFGQAQSINSNETISGSLFGKPSTTQGFGELSGFGVNQSFGNSVENADKNRSTGVSLFGQTNECVNSQKAFGNEPAFGQFKDIPRPQSGVLFHEQGLVKSNSLPTLCNNQFNLMEEERGLAADHPVTETDGELSKESNFKSVHYKPTFGTDVLANYLCPVQTKTNCITAMNEYANKSLEEIRLNDYSRIFSESPKQSNPTADTVRKEETAASNSTANTTIGYSPSRNMMGNTNQAFFDQLHQLIPYLNAGSFCKCNRSCNASKSQSNTQTLANNQPRSNNDSLDHLYGNTRKPLLNDNITIDEFYNDVFKYLDYIQKQYRHLESTLSNKNSNDNSEENLNKSATEKADETPNQNALTSPMAVFGSSTYSATKSSSIEKNSEDNTITVGKTSEANKNELFGLKINIKKPEAAAATAGTSGTSDNLNDSTTLKEKEVSKTQNDSKTTDSLNPEEDQNKNSPVHTQTVPISLFGTSSSSPNSAVAEKSTTTAEANVPSIFGSSVFSTAGTTSVTSSCTKENTNTKNDEINPAKRLSFFTGFDNTISFGTSKPVDFSYLARTDKPSDAAKTKETNKTLDEQLNGIKTSTPGIFSSNVTSNETASTLTGSLFATKNTTSNNTVEENPKSIFSLGFSSQNPLTTPVFSTKDTSSNSAGDNNSLRCFKVAVSRKKYDNTLNSSPFSTKSNENASSGSIFSCENSNTEVEKPFSIFSSSLPIKLLESTSSAPFSTKDCILSGTTGSTGLFSFNVVNNNQSSIFASPFLINKENKSDQIEEKESNAKTANVSESKANDLQNAPNIGGSPGGINIVKAVNSLKSIITNDNKTHEESFKEKSASTKQLNQTTEGKGGIVSSPVFKMKKISDILADISDKEENQKKSLSKSDSDSDISNYSLISNPSYDKDKSSIQNEENPTGIVMKRYGYYILPSKEDLTSKITDDGVCLVSNFTIGRKGYGSICFNKTINVAGLNVDNIVHFRNKEIIIYPNEHMDPQVIADLKKCDVLVTLEQVWPHDNLKHEPIKDPQHLDNIKYEDKLRLVCHKNDVHFVEYRPETGSWLFKMKNLDKNNINCWDVEDEDDIVENKNSTGIPKIIKLKQQNRRARIAAHKILFIAKRKAMAGHFS